MFVSNKNQFQLRSRDMVRLDNKACMSEAAAVSVQKANLQENCNIASLDRVCLI